MLIFIERGDETAGDLLEAIDFYIERKADSGQEKRLRKVYRNIEEVRR